MRILFKKIQNVVVLIIVGIMILYYTCHFNMFTPIGFSVMLLVILIMSLLIYFGFTPLLPETRPH